MRFLLVCLWTSCHVSTMVSWLSTQKMAGGCSNSEISCCRNNINILARNIVDRLKMVRESACVRQSHAEKTVKQKAREKEKEKDAPEGARALMAMLEDHKQHTVVIRKNQKGTTTTRFPGVIQHVEVSPDSEQEHMQCAWR
jgi:hypothetical protein